MPTVEQRVEKLEGQLRSARRLLAALVILPGAALLIAQAPTKEPSPVQETLRANRFELVDSAGSVRGVLGLTADGAAALWLNDKAGKANLAMVYATPDGNAGLRLSDLNSKLRGAFAVRTSEPFLSLFSPEGKETAKLSAASSSQATIKQYKVLGESRGAAGYEKDLNASLAEGWRFGFTIRQDGAADLVVLQR